MQSVSETYILECFRNKWKDLTLRTAAERQSCDGFKQLYCAGQPTSSTSSWRTVSLICSNLGVWLPSAGGVQTLHYTRPALADVRPTPLYRDEVCDPPALHQDPQLSSVCSPLCLPFTDWFVIAGIALPPQDRKPCPWTSLSKAKHTHACSVRPSATLIRF